MPRTTPADRKLAKSIDAAIAARPFSPEHAPTDPVAFANLPEPVQRGVAVAIASAKASGASGDDLRERFGGARDGGKSGGLTGPMRRTVLRTFGLATAKTIARSYAVYSDGEARTGSAASREHGPRAAARQAEAVAAVEAAAQAAQKRADAAAKRKAKRAASAR